jgi:hypothetical protein
LETSPQHELAVSVLQKGDDTMEVQQKYVPVSIIAIGLAQFGDADDYKCMENVRNAQIMLIGKSDEKRRHGSP